MGCRRAVVALVTFDGPMKPTSTELDVECPKCGAIPGEKCRNKKIKHSHLSRRNQELKEIILSQLPARNERSLWVR